MSNALEKRLEALENRQSISDPIVIIRFVVLGGDPEAEPVRATVGGRSLLRTEGESGDAFLDRVKAEAKQAAKPGCVGVALVFPQEPSDSGSVA